MPTPVSRVHDDIGAVVAARADVDAARHAVVLDGVGQRVDEHLAKAAGIAFDGRALSAIERDVDGPPAQPFEHRHNLSSRGRSNRKGHGQLEPPGLDAGNVEDLVNEG